MTFEKPLDASSQKRTADLLGLHTCIVPPDCSIGDEDWANKSDIEPGGTRSKSVSWVGSMSVQHLKNAVAAGDRESVIRFVRMHLGDGREEMGRREIDKAWVEATKILLADEQAPDEAALEQVMASDPATLANLFYRLHFLFVRKSGEWIHDGSQ